MATRQQHHHHHHTPSPGNAFSTGEPPMRTPHLEFLYRIVAHMGPGPLSVIPNVHGTGITRLVLPIAGGTVRGPRVRGEIVRDSGADWAQRIDGGGGSSAKLPTTKLNARYTLRTDDGHLILVNAVGTLTARPPAAAAAGESMAAGEGKASVRTITQDDAEYFTHITFEAAGGGSPYDWMNSVIAVGVMTMFEGKPVIDCYSLTNFPGKGIAAHL